jgi:hypothetical protein
VAGFGASNALAADPDRFSARLAESLFGPWAVGRGGVGQIGCRQSAAGYRISTRRLKVPKQAPVTNAFEANGPSGAVLLFGHSIGKYLDGWGGLRKLLI